MIYFILLWFSVSMSIFFLKTIKMLECLNSDKYTVVPNITKRTHVVFDSVFIGYAIKHRGKIHQFGNCSLMYHVNISLTGVKHFITNNKRIVTGDIVYVDGYLDVIDDKVVLTDVNFIAKKNDKLISRYLDSLLGKISITCLGVMLCLRYHVELLQLFMTVKAFLSNMVIK